MTPDHFCIYVEDDCNLSEYIKIIDSEGCPSYQIGCNRTSGLTPAYAEASEKLIRSARKIEDLINNNDDYQNINIYIDHAGNVSGCYVC